MNAVMTIREQLEAGYPFDVNKLPLMGPDGYKTDFYGCFRSDNDKMVGNPVKKGYVPHNLDDLEVLCEAGMEGFDGASMECKWYGDGHRIVIAPTADYRRSIFGTKDNTYPRAIIGAGYGGGCFWGELGIWRDICLNLILVRPEGMEVSMRFKHTTSLRDNIASLVLQFKGLLDKWNGIADHFVEMNDMTVDVKEFVLNLFPKPEKQSETQEAKYLRKIEAIIQRVKDERIKLNKPVGDLKTATAWELFNGVQGHVQHKATRRGKPDQYGRIFMAGEDKIVQRAYDLTLEMAS